MRLTVRHKATEEGIYQGEEIKLCATTNQQIKESLLECQVEGQTEYYKQTPTNGENKRDAPDLVIDDNYTAKSSKGTQRNKSEKSSKSKKKEKEKSVDAAKQNKVPFKTNQRRDTASSLLA